MTTDKDVLLLLGRIDERTKSTHERVGVFNKEFTAHKMVTISRIGILENTLANHLKQDAAKRIDDKGAVATTNGSTPILNGKTKTVIKVALVIGALIGSALLGMFGVFPLP